MYTNAAYYADHPLIKYIFSKNQTSFQTEDSVFSMMLSHFATKNFVFGNDCTREKCIIDEAYSTLVVGRYSSIMCICALASVLGKSLSSYSPSPVTSRLHSLRNFTVDPRTEKDVTMCPLMILWSRCSSEINAEIHFVPLVAESPNVTSSKPRVLSQGSLSNFLPTTMKRKPVTSAPRVGKF